MNKNEFIDKRTKIISDMLDNPEAGVYPTTKCFAELDALFDLLTEKTLTKSQRGSSWEQIANNNNNNKPKPSRSLFGHR